MGTVLFFCLQKMGTVPSSATLAIALLLFSAVSQGADHANDLFSDDFEHHTAGVVPGAPWKEETYKSGAVITVDGLHAFSGKQSMHVFAPRGAQYRRGYMALHLKAPVPDAMPAMYGRVMVWLDAAPLALPGAPPVHWTLLQGEGRSADDTYNPIYRLGVEQRAGTQLMANFETTPPVTTDCKQQSKLTLPIRRWACVEWHMSVASNEMQFWLDGREITHVKGRARAADACRGDDLHGEWRAPPVFNSLYMGLERYADSANDQDLWMDDVVLSKGRVGCPAGR